MKSELLSSSSVKEFIEGDWEAVFAAPDAIAPHFQDEPGNGEQPVRCGGWPPCMVGELLGVKLSYSDDIFIILDWNLNHGFISISTSTELTKAHPTCLSSVQMM